MAPADGKKLVVVLGATGAQGTPIIEHLLKQSPSIFRIRAVARDPNSAKAQALSKLGAEVAKADFDDESALRQAFQGANAIFSLTDFYDKSTIDSELYRGLLIARVASEIPTLENFIFSALPDARSLFGGKFQFILPYNSKTYIKEGIQKGYPSLWEKTTVLYVSYYYQNWLKYPAIFGPVKGPDGTFVLRMPHSADDSVSTTSSLDTGAVVEAILKAGPKYHGRTVALVTQRVTEKERLEIWAKTLGVKAVFEQVNPDKYKKNLESLGIPSVLAEGMTELAQVVAGQQDYVETDGVVKGREIIDPSYELSTWEQYVKQEDWSGFLGN